MSVASVDPCAAFSSCAECVYDSFLPITETPVFCTWCETTAVCSSMINTTCTALRSPTDSTPMCSDMQCSAAATTGNIYWCHPGTIVAAVFAFELLLLTALYWFWMRTIHQVPWKYPTIHAAVDQYNAGPSGPIQITARSRGAHGCPICHVETGKMYAPGAVCFWCDVARYAFIPFVIGLTFSLIAIFALFTLSLRPSFANTFYGVMIAIPHALYLALAAWVASTRRPVHWDPEQRPTAFVDLCIVLRGRRLDTVFEIVAAKPSVSTAGSVADSSNAAAEDDASSVSDGEQHVDTLQMLELDTSIPHIFRDELKEILRPGEYMVWREQPTSGKLLVHLRWLVCSFAGGAFLGFFMVIIAGIGTSSYPAALLGPTPMRLWGLLILGFSLLMFAITFSGMKRLYVMTNRRLLLLSSGIFASTDTVSTELDHVTSASIHGYQELGYTILTFRWNEKSGSPPRRMPKTKMTEFAGVVMLDQLLEKFGEYCDSLDSEGEKSRMDQLRATWRVHFGVLSGGFMAAPICMLSPRALPTELGVVGVIIMWFFCLVLAQRGLRVMSTTTAHLNLAKQWGRYGPSGFSFSRLVNLGALRRVRPAAIIKTVVHRRHSPNSEEMPSERPQL